MRVRAFPRHGILAIVAGVVLAGCQVETEPEPIAEEETSESRWQWEEDLDSIANNWPTGEEIEDEWDMVADALSGLGELIQSATGGEHVEPVPAEELEKLLPRRVSTFRRSEYEAHSNQIVLGFAGVEATYGSEEEGISMTIVDTAQLRGLAGWGVSALFKETVDSMSDTGFERSRTYRSRGREYPSYEEYHESEQKQACTVLVWVEERFLVGATGHNLSMDACESARDSISYRRLRQLAEQYAPREAEYE